MVPLAPGQEVIGNETDSATLSFRIDEAAPPVLLQGLQWFYVANFGSNPFAGQDITNLTNRTAVSTLTFSEFDSNRFIDLTVSNITQQRSGIGGETDEGRYFLVATNPAGVQFSYIDLMVFGTYIVLYLMDRFISSTVFKMRSYSSLVPRPLAVFSCMFFHACNRKVCGPRNEAN